MRRLLSICILICFAPALHAQQTVFLDFDSGVDGTIDYTTLMRDQVQSFMESSFRPFDITFTQTNPGSGPFSTLTFNSGEMGGRAFQIDFRNLDKSDSGVINVDGFGFATPTDVAIGSANFASHQLGHLLGARHYDGFGPIGSGVTTGVASRFTPEYLGPENANETGNHFMSTTRFGTTLERYSTPQWLGERTAIKLTFNEHGTTVVETTANNDTFANAQAITMANMTVPNTIVSGQNAGLNPFDVDALTITGSIGMSDVDVYSFFGEAGDLFNFELISFASRHRLDPFDTQISIFDANGEFVDYYGARARNDDEFESRDSLIVDLTLAETGQYFIQVNGDTITEVGDYELFFHRFNGVVPEPGSAGIMLAFALAFGLRRRSR